MILLLLFLNAYTGSRSFVLFSNPFYHLQRHFILDEDDANIHCDVHSM